MLQKACSLRCQTQADAPAVIGHGFLTRGANVATGLKISLFFIVGQIGRLCNQAR